MNSTVDTSAALAPAAARFDRQHAGTRQQRWMAELEQAMLAQQPGQRPAEPAPQAREDSAAARPEAAQAAPAAARPQAVAASARSGAATPAAPSSAAQSSPDHQAAAVHSDASTAHRAAGAVAAGPDDGDDNAVAAWTDPATAGIALQLAVAAAGAGTSAAVVAAAAGEPAPQEAIAATAGPRSGGGLAFGLAGALRQDAAIAQGMAETFEGAAAPEAAASDEQYSKNLLHLFHGEDGVQAYIRDAELSGAQMRAVAQALAAELGAGGTRLAAVTINGRRLPVGAANPYEQQDEEPPVAQRTLPAAHRPFIEEKGAI